MVTEAPRDSVQPCRVQLCVDEEQDEETGQESPSWSSSWRPRNLEWVAAEITWLNWDLEEVDIGKNCHRCIVVGGAPTASANAVPQIAAAAGS